MYDIIGDIHGYCSKLKELLLKLEYTEVKGVWKHPERKIIFVGDYIDRGPEIRETLHLVRNMVEADAAIALMGNHEFNALAYHIPDGKGEYLRSHTPPKTHQHSATLAQFYFHRSEWESFLSWIRLLPLTYENDHFRCVHACWDNSHIGQLLKIIKNGLTPQILSKATKERKDDYYILFEEVLKGKEVDLPKGLSFLDKDGILRDKIRIRWWLDPSDLTYHQYCIHELLGLDKTLKITNSTLRNPLIYGKDEKPVFFGHYWLHGRPYLMRDNVCCLDFSVANSGYIVAYRWNGESILKPESFIYV
jgi:Calcineurin-like phosphoesterase